MSKVLALLLMLLLLLLSADVVAMSLNVLQHGILTMLEIPRL